MHFETTTLVIYGVRRPGQAIEINKDGRFVVRKTYMLIVTYNKNMNLLVKVTVIKSRVIRNVYSRAIIMEMGDSETLPILHGNNSDVAFSNKAKFCENLEHCDMTFKRHVKY